MIEDRCLAAGQKEDIFSVEKTDCIAFGGHSALGCTCTVVSDDGLMMIMTIWTQSGCHLKRFKNVTFPHFAIFWPFWAKKTCHSKSS